MTTSTDYTERVANVADGLSSSLLVLDRFNHRHKNQHRVATWWARFDLFRRSVRRLLDTISTYEQLHGRYARARSTAKQRDRKEPSELVSQRDAILKRARWLSGHVIPTVYLPFTQLVADNQHATLGLLLLGLTSRVKAAIAPLLGDAQEPHPPPQVTSTTEPSQLPSSATVGEPAPLDFGVVVSRSEASLHQTYEKTPSSQQPVSGDQPPQDRGRDRLHDDQPPAEISTQARISKKSMQKPKKRKKGDEFSELFGSLL
ncbi:hypothetical protein SODALDRAFT_333450 [Sodiomyces alkalinus F11]|uniref:RNase MRP protein 1 RNA binding domain-containing protein n=1 Tax=Sodiomyces alkalinus (strain CBS 110278 / VKM F-3762 / F11) TaxID=1314773 RepID=A0A3N2PWF9_SODAK|nr:hypothetical protein SODALDRAFT_333450 [Sodiomyces alkalinus F11]ROT38822.1 hypothetical protein SODALDRAFT_333450 [Sodiomyces alkalinus F11]